MPLYDDIPVSARVERMLKERDAKILRLEVENARLKGEQRFRNPVWHIRNGVEAIHEIAEDEATIVLMGTRPEDEKTQLNLNYDPVVKSLDVRSAWGAIHLLPQASNSVKIIVASHW